MKDGKCTKCGSSDVLTNARAQLYVDVPYPYMPGRSGLEAAPNNQELPCEDAHVYVCGNCGYTETYVEGIKALDRLRREWSKVVR